MAAELLDVIHQIGRGVGDQATERAGAAGAALVEDDDTPERRVEETAVHGPGSGAGAAVQKQHWAGRGDGPPAPNT